VVARWAGCEISSACIAKNEERADDTCPRIAIAIIPFDDVELALDASERRQPTLQVTSNGSADIRKEQRTICSGIESPNIQFRQ
jgi:hypothetical protein